MNRCFFAVFPPARTRAALAVEAARAASASGGRAVAAGNLHLTLVFLGRVEDARLARLAEVAAAVRVRRFALRLDERGRFDRGRVAWIAPGRPPGALLELHDALARGCRAAGFELERRGYRPHVTLARDLRPAPRTRDAGSSMRAVRADDAPTDDAPARSAAASPAIAWTVRDFVLVVSLTAARGPVYTPIGRWALVH